jgi:uncharacterized DUF497 family protein
MVLRFVWDSRKASANARKHEVDFPEATTVFADPLSATIEDVEHSMGETRCVTIGASISGRIIVVVHADDNDEMRIISARRATPKETRQYMAKVKSDRVREVEAEYDFSGGERGRYAKRYAEGTNVVVLDPDVAEVFRSSAEVNEALRALARIAKRERGSSPPLR